MPDRLARSTGLVSGQFGGRRRQIKSSRMKSSSLMLVLLVVCGHLLASSSLQLSNVSPSRSATEKSKRQIEVNDVENEIADQPLKVPEPYKFMLETTARFALAQTQVTKLVNLDTAVRMFMDTTAMLLKPAVLLKIAGFVLPGLMMVATLLPTMKFFFPGALKFIETVVRDPLNTLSLDQYAIEELRNLSLIEMIGVKTDKFLARVGLEEARCKEESLCRVGELLRCTFPKSSGFLLKFTEEIFSNTTIKDHRYAEAFRTGFVDRSCLSITGASCFSNLASSLLGEQRIVAKSSRHKSPR